MRLVAAAGSHTGKVRKNNEDNFCFDGMILKKENNGCEVHIKTLSSEVPHLLGVFDGMGGHSNGEYASYLTANIAKDYIGRLAESRKYQQLLMQLCMDANDTVCEASNESMMGTTAALLCIHSNRYTVCNVGDSPIFRFRERRLEQISEEHTQRASYERTTGKPAKPGHKFMLTQCIGIPKEEMRIEPFCTEGNLCDNDVFLICSDGLTDMVSPVEIQSILLGTDSPEVMVHRLIDRALDAGGRDNITVICVRVQGNVPRVGYAKGFFRKLWNGIVSAFAQGVKI